MDKCHAPDCPSLKVPDGKAIENPDMLALFHNGPEWMRLSCDERSGKDRILSTSEMDKKDEREERAERLKEEEVMKQAEVTGKIVELAKKGKSVEEIMAATDSTKTQVKNAINRAKMNGELPYTGPKKLITRAAPRKAAEKAMEAMAAAIEKPMLPVDYIIAAATPAAPAPIVENAPEAPKNSDFIELGLPPRPASAPEAPLLPASLDVAKLHKMIDLVARFPELSESLLKSCDEIETAARYQLSLVAEIREALSA